MSSDLITYDNSDMKNKTNAEQETENQIHGSKTRFPMMENLLKV